MSNRACPACSKPLVRKPNESKRAYFARQYCDRTCLTIARRAASFAKTANLLKHCRTCNAKLERREDETAQHYESRVYCDATCAKRNVIPRRRHSQFTVSTPTLDLSDLATERHETIRMRVLGEPCPVHPGEKIGFYGCCACNASAKWRAQQHELKGRPHSDSFAWVKTR